MITTDLGQGWFANQHDGALTLRNGDQGQRVTLAAEQAARLRAALATPPKALRDIIELAKPGQEVTVSQAVDILCEIWNIARAATAEQEPVE